MAKRPHQICGMKFLIGAQTEALVDEVIDSRQPLCQRLDVGRRDVGDAEGAGDPGQGDPPVPGAEGGDRGCRPGGAPAGGGVALPARLAGVFVFGNRFGKSFDGDARARDGEPDAAVHALPGPRLAIAARQFERWGIQAQVPGIPVQVLDAVSHWPQLDAPDEVNARLEAWAAERPRGMPGPASRTANSTAAPARRAARVIAVPGGAALRRTARNPGT